jgi:hypothetical protein
MENPPAFPIPDVRTHDGFGISEGSPGMTLRDWFAGQALTGASAGLYSGSELTTATARMLAKEAFMLADAMLATRTVDAPAGRGA